LCISTLVCELERASGEAPGTDLAAGTAAEDVPLEACPGEAGFSGCRGIEHDASNIHTGIKKKKTRFTNTIFLPVRSADLVETDAAHRVAQGRP